MGRHISLGIAHPVFCYGSYYGGTLEPHLTALFFSALGATPAVYRISLMVFLAVLLVLVYAMGRRFFGRGPAIVATAYLAVPPFFFLLKGLTSDGAYDSLAILGAVIAYAAFRLDEAIANERATKTFRLWLAILGVAAGLAWWVHPLSIYFFAAVLAWFAIVRPAAFRRFHDYPIFFLAFLVGSLPWWLENLRNGFLSFAAGELTSVTTREIPGQLVLFFTQAVPVLLGGRSFYSARDSFPGAPAVALALYLAVFVATAVRVVRTRSSRTPGWRALLLLLLLLLTIPFFASLSSRSFKADPRFFFPLYVPFALLLGYWIVELGRRFGRSAAVAAAVALLAFHGAGFFRTESQNEPWQMSRTGSVAPLVRELERLGIHDVYTGYWTAYRIAFESGERIRPGIFGREAADRYPAYLAQVDASENRAVVLSEPEASVFRAYLARVGSRARETRVGVYSIFHGLEPHVLSEIRRARGTPGDPQLAPRPG